MKKVLSLFLLCFAVQAADTRTTIKISVIGNPIDGNTLTLVVNGSTYVRTWKTAITSSSSQILIGATAADSANNLLAQITANTPTYIDGTIQESVTNITLLASLNKTFTASASGSWPTITSNTTTFTTRAFVIPTPANSNGTNDVNELILSFGKASSAFAANLAALSNYVNVTLAQTITGAKTFSLATFGTANVTNLNVLSLLAVTGSVLVTNGTPELQFWASSGGTDAKSTKLLVDSSGFNVIFRNDADSGENQVLQIQRSGYDASQAIFSSRLKANYIYDTPLSNVTFKTWVALTNNGGGLTNGWITNSVAGLTRIDLNGPMSLTNNAWLGITNSSGDFPIFKARSTDPLSTPDLRQFELWMGYNGVLQFLMRNDAGTVATQIMSMDDSLGVTIQKGLAVLNNAAVLYAGALSGQPIQAAGFLASGVDGLTGATNTFGGDYGLLLEGNASDLTSAPPGAFIWNNGGLKYRTVTTSEGAGGTFWLHNRTGTTQGAGTDYTLTSSTAAVDFGTTDPQFTAPTAGTYLIWAEVAITAGATPNDDYRAKLRNTTTSTDITSVDESITHLGASEVGTIKMLGTATLAASDVVAIYAHNNTAARGTVNSARTRIGYVRLY